MQINFGYLAVAKRGNNQKDYEDAFAPKLVGSLNQQHFSAAIADGATESSFAGEWAKMLVRNYVKAPDNKLGSFKSKIEFLAAKWHSCVFRTPLPWFAEEKARLGAFAAFLGIEFKPELTLFSDRGFWSGLAIGDCCLFQFRDGNQLLSFPYSSSQ